MGQSKLFNIPTNTLRPGPRLVINRAPEGLTTATLDFTCRKFEVMSPAMQAKLAQGTSLLTLYPDAGTDFDFLYLESWESRDREGGITDVTVNFRGTSPQTGEFGFDGAVIYLRNNALREESIFNHPRLKSELSVSEIYAIRLCIQGLALKDESGSTGTSYSIVRAATFEPITNLAGDALWWFDYIVTNDNQTYQVATSEWTKQATGRGGMPSSVLANFGKIDTPPGNPAAPSGDEWLFTGATEQISVSGDAANSYSLTWTSGKWETRVYSDV